MITHARWSRGSLKGWLILTILCGTMAYAIAEEITLTTYYPSPRGIYQEVRTTNNAYLAMQQGSVGIGLNGTTPAAAKLHIQLPAGGAGSSTTPGLLIEGGSAQQAPSILVQGAAVQNGPFMQFEDAGGDVVAVLDAQGRWRVGNRSGWHLDPTRRNLRSGIETDGGLVVGATYVGAQNPPADGAIIEGKVGIGTPLPQSELEISGHTTTTTIGLAPLANHPANPVEGMLYFNEPLNTVYLYSQNQWRSFVQFVRDPLGQRIASVGSQILPQSWELIGAPPNTCPGPMAPGTSTHGPLCVTNVTRTAGFYSISWQGTMRIDAQEEKSAVFQLKRGGSIVTQFEFFDDDGAKDNRYTTHAIDGGAIVLLNRNENPQIRLVGKRVGSNSNNSSIVEAGASLTVELILPF